VVDGSRPAITYGNQQLLVTVNNPPGFLAKYRWDLIGAVVLLLLCAVGLYVLRLTRRNRIDVRGLWAMLLRDGDMVHELKALEKRAAIFPFMIRDTEGEHPRLDYPQPGERSYQARRGTSGHVSLTSPDGAKYEIAPGGASQPLPGGLQLAFRDTRQERTAGQRPDTGSDSGAQKEDTRTISGGSSGGWWDD
jgi:hypothetical protein